MTWTRAANEKIIWEGSPSRGLRFGAYDLFLVPFALIWLVAVFGISLATTMEPQAENADPMAFIILPVFLLVGLYMLVGRFILDMLARRRTRYLLTSHGPIIEGGLFRTTRRSVNLAAVPEVRFRPGRNGRGTIEFGSASPFFAMPSGWPGARQFMPPAFEGIENAEHVYRLVLDLQRQALAGRRSDLNS